MTKQKRSFFRRFQKSHEEVAAEKDTVAVKEKDASASSAQGVTTDSENSVSENTKTKTMNEQALENNIENLSQKSPKKEDDYFDEEKNEDFEGQLTIDVFQNEDSIIIKSTIAGVEPEDLDISINNDMITIKGERKNEATIKEDDYFYQECYWGGFSRSVILPMEVNADEIEAELKNGILTVILPKAQKSKTKKIQVKQV
ncbi:MAG: Hsp20/alpha crystallin family protein [bacterium]